MMKYSMIATVVFALSSTLAQADELTDAANQVCEKVKQCTLSQIDQSQMTPEIRAMMEPMINGMCDAMRAGVKEVPNNHELYQPAVACMRSMAELSCEDYQNEESFQTPACTDYAERAEKAMADE
ncbi:hypothetical protein EY643_14695 [Halioglobus maricola]|uniref:Uncharacterized protein n=1 Tax=Halioglobus maricola TaxID=2601894 RepID=A0A5P9NPH0_9GAMM|nr:hypothetical protein [Halioglobus maricola]QFU76798.1 hypothetical protein EY643_14695 [Halioglobus maricola]